MTARAIANTRVVTLVLVLTLSALRCDPLHAQDDFFCADGGEMTYAELNKIGVMNPYDRVSARGPSDRIYSLIYEPLVFYDLITDDQRGILAEAWQISSSGRTMTFYLRQGILWHDGTPFSADDVTFTFDYIRNAAPYPWVDRTYFTGTGIESVTKEDDFTVTASFQFPVSESVALQLFSDTWIIPRHLFGPGYRPTGEGPSLSDVAVGTGPYRQIRAQDPMGNVELRRFDDYWGGAAHVEFVTMQFEPDETNLTNRLLANRAGRRGLNLLVEVPTDDIVLVREAGFPIESYTTSYNFFGLAHNMANPVLARREVRRAITHAVNRDELLEQWFAGQGWLISGPFTPNSPYYNPDVDRLAYDPARARQMLESSGVTDRDGDGIREIPGTNQPVRLRCLYERGESGTNTKRSNIATSFTNALRDIGIAVECEGLPGDAYSKRLSVDRDFDVALVRWEFGTGYNITEMFQTGGTHNVTGYSNLDVDAYLELFAGARDRDVRIAHMHTLHLLLNDDAPYTWLFSLRNSFAHHQRFIRSNPDIDSYYFFTYFKDWCVSRRFE